VGNSNHDVLVTCGNETDPRIQLQVDIADALTLIFMLDDSIQHPIGINLIVLEIDAAAATVRNIYFTNCVLASFCYTI